jgi:putative hemolysin
MIWFAIFACWIVSFLFHGIEAGLLAVDPVRLRARAKRGEHAPLRLERLLKHPERLLVTVLLVTNMADILALLLLTQRLVRRFGSAGFFVSLIIALPIHAFILGVLPKSLFRRFPFRALATLGGLLDIVSTVLWPVLESGKQLGRLFLPPQKSQRVRLFAAREELKQITAQSEREGSLTAAERVMIHNVVDFTAVKARDVMVPLSKTVTVEPQTPIEKILEVSLSTHIDRLPVVSRQGEALGLVNVPDILFDKNETGPLEKYLRRIVTAREDESAYRLIQRLRAARLSLAAIVDAKRKLTGVVTAEELIKRLVSSAPEKVAASI